VLLASDWVENNLGEKIAPKTLKALEAMDEPGNIGELDRIGRLAGGKLVMADHFPKTFDLA
jgi:hypothetical protein